MAWEELWMGHIGGSCTGMKGDAMLIVTDVAELRVLMVTMHVSVSACQNSMWGWSPGDCHWMLTGHQTSPNSMAEQPSRTKTGADDPKIESIHQH